MKNVKRYLSISLALALVAPAFTGCHNGLDEYSAESSITPPSDRFNAEIQFVTRLTDGTLASNDADYTAIDNYIVNTLEGKNKSWLAILDRMDGANQQKTMQTALDTKRWTAFAFNKITNRTAYEGSTLYYNNIATDIKGTPVGTTYVTGFVPTMNGLRIERDDDGTILSTASVSFNINFCTARFETSDQINAFGGKNGVLKTLHYANQNLLMVGTVKNDLLGALQTGAQGLSSSMIVREVAKGSAYTIFLLADGRFWDFASVTSTSLGNGIEAYSVNIMW
ncbi:hypothetical protein [uncultured Alistipes sp.]|jgi:lipoprotein|uniref:hypothetical protein n=1 Tax=uncultured Alistipes sp. TaxID=538949 RepID=UPI0025E6DACC|nr:hypothetical protein [uncultured Alistipes sp.]